MTKIKICGLSRLCDIDYVNTTMPDYIGFVFAPHSKRYVSPSQASQLKARLSPCIKAAGVFVGEEAENILDIAGRGIIDIIQLHGSEDDHYISKLKAVSDVPIIKAFSIKSKKDIQTAVLSSADYILLDNGAGGTGDVFDWSLISEISRPYFLAGGLTPNNVEQAVAINHPFAVDASSGVETDGVKDFNKIKAFIDTVRKSNI